MTGPLPPPGDRLGEAAQRILRRARQQKSVLPSEVRDELTQVGLSAAARKDVLRLAGPALCFRRGRYYYVPAGRKRMRIRLQLDQQQQRLIQQKVRWMIRLQRGLEAAHHERRVHKRVEFSRPVLLQTEDGRRLHVISREISASGIRLVSGSSLLGQRVHIWIPFPEAGEAANCFRLCVLWSAAVGDNLYENGGVFLGAPEERPPENGKGTQSRPRE